MKRVVLILLLCSAVGIFFLTGLFSMKSNDGPEKPAGKEYPPGIVLSFDDDYIDDWYEAEKQMEPYHWKATFFICKYELFTPEQKEKLHYLQKKGHDIAGHGYMHRDAVKYTAQFGIERYLNDEIVPMKSAMSRDGFNVHSFAYPEGSRNAALDEALLQDFDIIRGTTYGELDPEVQYCYYEGKRVIYGLGIDDDYKQFNVPYYKRLMDYAKEHHKIVIFYGHKIVKNADERLETPTAALQEICRHATENGLKFYTVDDLKKL